MLLNGMQECSCKKKKCERHGKCDECVEFHKNGKREPYCMRNKKIGLVEKLTKNFLGLY